jgi:hypothetical protein
MSFRRTCGPCGGSGFYGLNPGDTCKICKGLQVVEVEGVLQDYRTCVRCGGSGFYGINARNTCETCAGLGIIPTSLIAKSVARKETERGVDSQILIMLQGVSPSAAASYEQAILDLGDESRKSMRGTAAELREALREVLDSLAPDSAVMNEPGFKLEEGRKEATMRQKARFVLRSRRLPKTDLENTEKAVSIIEELVASLVRGVYGSGSIQIHAEATRPTVRKLKMYVDTVLSELLEIHRAR